MQRTDPQLRLEDWAVACAAKQRPSRADVMPAAQETAIERTRRLHRAAQIRLKETGILLIRPDNSAVTKTHILANVDRDETKGCWNWKRSKNDEGYGNVKHLGKPWKVHRVVWELWRGEIPAGLLVLHRCDNPPCCNPDHLFLGTDLDNTRDKISKGRNPHKLSKDQLLSIKRDQRLYRIITAEYGISQGMVSMIKSGKRGVILTL